MFVLIAAFNKTLNELLQPCITEQQKSMKGMKEPNVFLLEQINHRKHSTPTTEVHQCLRGLTGGRLTHQAGNIH